MSTMTAVTDWAVLPVTLAGPGGRLAGAVLGEQLGSGQPHLVAGRAVTGNGGAGGGGGGRVDFGKLLGGGQAVFVGVGAHGGSGFLCEGAGLDAATRRP